jgi:hypothetical protein
MTLDASGNLGLGTTSPKLNTNAGTFLTVSNTTSDQSGWLEIQGAPSSAGVGAGQLSFNNSNRAGSDKRIAQISCVRGSAADSGIITFTTWDAGSAAERARITSGGYSKFSNTGSYSNSGLYHEFYQTNNTTALLVRATNSTFTETVLTIQGDRTTTNTSYYLIDSYNGNVSGRFRVADSGNATNTNNSYGAISDAKLKENIVDASPKLADLMQVKVRNYNLIGSQIKQLGVVAQELEAVFPSMVDEASDKDADGNDLGTTTKSVKYSVFVPMLIKAIQEQQAIIESLKARLDAANL